MSPIDEDPLDLAFQTYAHRVALTFLGQSFTYADLDAMAERLAIFWQGQGLHPGDRIAVMMPNWPQYVVAVSAIWRAGFVLVNINPHYIAQDLSRQLKDSGAKAMVIADSVAHVLQACEDVSMQRVIVCTMGDIMGWLRGTAINHWQRHVHKQVPSYALKRAVKFAEALNVGKKGVLQRPQVRPQQMAMLQYTGGTTGVSKGAILTHANLRVNLQQIQAWFDPAFASIPARQRVALCALPLHHIFAHTMLLYFLCTGGRTVLIASPRDHAAMAAAVQHDTVHCIAGVNAIFAGLLDATETGAPYWDSLKLCVGGGMPVSAPLAQRWKIHTGRPIIQAYGLTETSPLALANPVTDTQFHGSIGLPVAHTELRLVDEDGQAVAPGQIGELMLKGPQVMAGYWQRPEETNKVLSADGWLRTGDMAYWDVTGRVCLAGRKKDMILVNGINIYPLDIEAVVNQMPGVQACAAVAMPDEETGEAVKLVVVRSRPDLKASQVLAYCETHLSPYKRPKQLVFANELPRTSLGKMTRHTLRESAREAQT